MHPARNSMNPQRNSMVPALLWVTMFAGTAVGFAVLFWLGPPKWVFDLLAARAGNSPNSNEVADPQDDPEQPQISLESADLSRAATVSRLVELQNEANTIDADLRLYEVELQRWNTQFNELMKSDDGKRVVAAGGYLDLFAGLEAKGRPDGKVVADWNTSLHGLRVPLDDLIANATTGTGIPDSYRTRIAELSSSVRNAAQELRQDQRAVGVILHDTVGVDPGSITLRAALDAKREADERALVDRLAEVRRIAEEEAKRKLELEEQKTVELENEVKMLREKGKQEKAIQGADALRIMNAAKEEEANRLAAKERLMAQMQADMEEIKTLLVPFIHDGDKHPDGGGFFKATGETGPVSLAALRGTGGLGETDDALKSLYFAGGHTTNDRPLGTFPRYKAGYEKHDADIRRRVIRARELLNKYGDLMVEQGLLAE